MIEVDDGGSKGSINRLPPGTIALRYDEGLGESHCYLVVCDHMERRLNANDYRLFAKDPGRYCICLELGMIADFKAASIFERLDKRESLMYVGIERLMAANNAFAEEMALCEAHYESSLLGGGLSPRQRTFGFTPKQHKLLYVIAIVKHYVSGGSIQDKPRWVNVSKVQLESLFRELQQALPLKEN